MIRLKEWNDAYAPYMHGDTCSSSPSPHLKIYCQVPCDGRYPHINRQFSRQIEWLSLAPRTHRPRNHLSSPQEPTPESYLPIPPRLVHRSTNSRSPKFMSLLHPVLLPPLTALPPPAVPPALSYCWYVYFVENYKGGKAPGAQCVRTTLCQHSHDE